MKYKIGNRVKVINKSLTDIIGLTGEIYKVCKVGTYDVWVRFDDRTRGCNGGCYMNNNELELIPTQLEFVFMSEKE